MPVHCVLPSAAGLRSTSPMPGPTRETAERWNRSLRGFRFNRAAGGPTLDMDNIFGRIRFKRGEAGLIDLFRRFDLPLQAFPPVATAPASERPGPTEPAPSPAPDYPGFAQPGFTLLFGAPVHLEIHANWVAILVTGARGFSWEVFEEDFDNAMMLEKIFALRGIEFMD